tara:strand:- start:17636 stop:18694 length:1059 start_codon:yes stop_codon:yes gene_type:complete
VNPFILSAVLLLALSASVCASSTSDTENVRSAPVTQVKAIKTRMISATNVQGEIESLNKPYIASKIDAEVVAVMFDEGMRVDSGSLLAKLDDEAFKIAEEKAEAKIQQIEILIESQQRELKRNQDLLGKRLISQSAVDDAITALRGSQAALMVTKAELKDARYRLSHCRILSPMAGEIQQRVVSKGDYVKNGDLLFQIASTKNLRARLYFPEGLASAIILGMEVTLTRSGETVTGKISSLRPMLEDGNRALHALVEFQNDALWKPGYSVVAQVTLDVREDAVVVPEEVLVRRPIGTVVYKIEGETVSEQRVTTGLKQGNSVEILSGLKEGDLIVLNGAAWLTDGASIRIREE